MKFAILRNSSQLKIIFMLITSLLLGLLCANAMAHEWTIAGNKVTAKAVDFNGSKVLLEDLQGNRKAIALNELNAADLQYLANLLAIRNAEIQQDLQRQQLQQQRAQFVSQFVDIWTVSMVAPNGEFGWRNYFAANSQRAQELAWQEFPNIRIVEVRRMRRAGQLSIGAGNAFVAVLSNRRFVIGIFP